MSESLKEIKFLDDLPDQVIVIDKFKTINFANKSAKTRFGSNIQSQNISSIVRDAELLDQIDKSLEKNQVLELKPRNIFCFANFLNFFWVVSDNSINSVLDHSNNILFSIHCPNTSS